MKLTVTGERSNISRSGKRGGNGARSYRRGHGHGSPMVFHGVDTEGSGKGSAHRPVLVSCGSAYVANELGVKWHEVFDFLYEQFQPGGHAYVGFYLAYDFTQWLRSLPEDRAWMLLTEGGRAARTRHHEDGTQNVYPVGAGKWEFDLLGFKRLKIRPKACKAGEECAYPHTARGNGVHRWMYICDVGPFFQCSFLKAINPKGWPEPIVTQEEYDIIEAGKAYRSDAVLDDNMIRYQQAEIAALEKLMDIQQTGLRDMDVYLKPKQWFGPGQIAQELMKKWNVPGSQELPDYVPQEWLNAAQASYYGGWFEIFAHGNVRKAYSYDINSAYPFVISTLPCLRHGKFSYGHGRPDYKPGELCLVHVSTRRMRDRTEWDPDNPGSIAIGSMPYRDRRGRIFRPLNTSGYYWQHEINAAMVAGCIEDIEYHEWFKYEPCGCPPPMADVAELYERRLKVGKNTPLGKGLKLGYNSIYGKMAQSVGHPQYGNPIYASLITAGCRTMILDAIATHPEKQASVLMVATDGVYFIDPHPGLTISKKLGDWEEEEHANLTLFKPGVYWDDSTRKLITEGKDPQFKARGVNAKDMAKNLAAIDTQYAEWPRANKDGSIRNMANRPQWHPKGKGWPSVEVSTTFAMVSVLQALQRKKWDLAGNVETGKLSTQSSAHHQKRWGLWWDPEKGIYRSIPRWSMGLLGDPNACPESRPYEKRFGIEDPWSDESQQALGITPDGSIMDIIHEMMEGE